MAELGRDANSWLSGTSASSFITLLALMPETLLTMYSQMFPPPVPVLSRIQENLSNHGGEESQRKSGADCFQNLQSCNQWTERAGSQRLWPVNAARASLSTERSAPGEGKGGLWVLCTILSNYFCIFEDLQDSKTSALST